MNEPVILPCPTNEPNEEPVNEPVALIAPKNSPLKEPVAEDAVNSFVINLSLTSTLPVNSCLSVNSSPNLFEPDE